MGVSIHGSAYDVADLTLEIDKFVKENGGYREGALLPLDFLVTVANDFGIILDSKFLTVYNEYYSDYNPQSQFFNAVMIYYFPDRREDIDECEIEFYPTRYKLFGDGANADDILETHFEDEFGYEGKFGYE